MIGSKAGNFFLGIIPEEQKNNWFWQDKGNELGFFYTKHYSHTFNTKGSEIMNIYKTDMIFIMEA